ncbi:MAG: LysR family transcriptional regulator [Rickettsiales bacterium]|nr:LysR family transcriptional regulator [Rickettsiales bacterium]
MNLRDLKYITTVSETLNFNRASELCFVSQPSLSKQIQKVESELGVQIFERTNKRVSVTPVGERIVQRAQNILRESEAIRQIAKQASNPLGGEFRLGIIPTIAPYLLPRLMPVLRKSLPSMSLSLVEGHTRTITQQLKNGELDAVFVALPLAEDGMHESVIYQESFLFTVPENHPLAKRKKVSIDDLAGEELLLLEDGHCLRAQALELCRMSGSQEAQGFSATSIETLRQMVAGGHGVTLMPALAADERISHYVRYIPFKDPCPSRQVGLVWRDSSPRKKLLEKLVQIISKEMKDMPRKGLSLNPV